MVAMPAAKLSLLTFYSCLPALLYAQTASVPGCGLSRTPQPCPILTSKGYMHQNPDGSPNDQVFEPPLSQQDVACTSKAATCVNNVCNYANGMTGLGPSNVWYELKPGSPAVCGHGNREFSFFAKKGTNANKVLLVLLAGGMCWDSATCLGSTPSDRKMAVDSLSDSYQVVVGGVPQTIDELAPAVPKALKNVWSPSGKSTFETGILQSDSQFADWSVVVVPDCTGDMHIGNRSITYDAGAPSCITAHHVGAVNTGLAVQWMMKYFPSLTDVLVVGTGLKNSKATGGSGASFWAWYVQERYPSAKIRSVTDSDLAIYGPDKKHIFQNDPWGTLNASVPDKSFLGSYTAPTLPGKKPNFLTQGFLLPAKNEWFFADDDKTYYMRYITHYYPSIIFADISFLNDQTQEMIFVQTGGKLHDCCYDGCSCNAQQEIRGGRYDWLKSQKVTILRRNNLLPNNYRIWLSDQNPHHFLFFWSDFVTHQLIVNDMMTNFYQNSTANTWLFNLVNSMVSFTTQAGDSTSIIISNNLKPSNTSICLTCLSGVLGSKQGEEKCLMSWGSGESSISVAPKFKTDWLALWSLNGGDSPDLIMSQSTYRFGHEYVILVSNFPSSLLLLADSFLPARRNSRSDCFSVWNDRC
mmetsp:Transcript_27991/g.90814  ORF Transcript_27991/g.90814 Transcript_27991/m.90814 type:complete len:637 (-) Transcript_27991:340-2250(-)